MLGTAFQADASTIEEAQQRANELESQKNAAEAEKSQLSVRLNEIIERMEETRSNIAKKQEEIQVKEVELIQAKLDENDQYQSMKKRIKYMYENGNVQFIEILFASKSIGDFLNNAEYITRISEYDRDMLVRFQEVVKLVEKQEAELQQENEQLLAMENELTEQQSEVEVLLADKNVEISNLEAEIGENARKLEELKAAAAEAERRRKEAEEAAKRQQQIAESGSGSAPGQDVVTWTGQLSNPCPSAYISSGYGPRRAPTAGASSYHRGIDFAAGNGTPIYAAEAGTVVTVAYSGARGNYVVINHGNGLSTLYQHCSAIYVSVGQSVSRGQNIAAVGSTGIVSGAHLHFEVWVNGSPVNPAGYL